MKSNATLYWLAASLAILGCESKAVILEIQPGAQTLLPVGDLGTVTLDVVGLDGLVALGAFDLEISYDSAVVKAASLTFGNGLALGAGSLRSFDLTTPGVVSLSEISFASAATLAGSQPAAFTLAQIGFESLAPGTTPLSFSFVGMADAAGATLTPQEMLPGKIVVPEPGPYAVLAGVGLLVFAIARRTRA